MNDFTRGYMRGYKDAQKEALSAERDNPKDLLAQPAVSETHKQRSDNEHLEPVARIGLLPEVGRGKYFEWLSTWEDLPDEAMLYTTPPTQQSCSQRPSRSDMTWVGLTQTEVVDLLCEYNKLTGNVGWQQLIYITEAKLKEKNTRNGGCL